MLVVLGGISCANQWPYNNKDSLMLNGCKSVRNNWSTKDYGGSEFQYPRPHTSSRRSTAGKASHSCFDVAEKLCRSEILHLWDPESLIPSRSPQLVRRFFWYGFVLILPQGIVWYFHDHWFHLWCMLRSHHSPLFRGPHLHIWQETLCCTSQGTSKFSLHLVRITKKIGPTVQPFFPGGILSYCPCLRP